ncbi:unnamed protein product [Calypogeia fissa]
MRDNSCCDLPLIPNVAVGFRQACQSVSLDGKIYVLGGGLLGSRKVYVLDLPGQRQWKPCASMIQPRVEFGCHVMNGKIYVFEGCVGFDSGSEVYDPKENTWSQIRPMITRYPSYHVEIVGEEFWVWNSEYKDYSRTMGMDRGNIEVYNPAKDEWREIPWSQTYSFISLVFMAQGKLHDLCLGSEYGITVHNAGENSWTHLHSCTFDSNGLVDWSSLVPMAVLEVNDELLAVVFWNYDYNEHNEGYCLVRSKELGSRWQAAHELTGSLKGIENYCPHRFSMFSFEL